MKLKHFWGLCIVTLLVGCGGSVEENIRRAIQLKQDGKRQEAELLLRKVLQKDGKSAEANYQLAKILAEDGKGNEALLALDVASREAPKREEIQIYTGDLLTDAYRITGAEDPFLRRLAVVASRVRQANPESDEGLRLEGQVKLFQEDIAGALERFRQARQKNPRNYRAALPEMDALQASGRADEAAKLGWDTIERNADAVAVYDQLYLLYLRQQDVLKAEEVLKRKAKSFPNEAAVQLQLARFYLLEGKREVAEPIVDRVRRTNGGELKVAEFWTSAGRTDEAARIYEEAIAAKRNILEASRKLGSLRMGEGKQQEAMAVLAAALEQFPGDLELQGLQALAALDLASGPPPGEVVEKLRELSVAKKYDANLPFQLARALARKGDVVGAERALNEALKRDPNFLAARYALGQLQAENGRHQRALEISEQILAEQPANAQAQLLQAGALAGLERYAEARALLNGLAAKSQVKLTASELLGKVLVREGRWGEATKLFEAIGKMPGGDTAAQLGKAEVLLAQGDAPGALELLSRAAADRSAVLELQVAYGDLAFAMGRLEQATKAYNAALVVAGGDASLRVKLARAQMRMKQWDQASEELRKIQGPDTPQLRALRADGFLGKGDYRQALNIYRQLSAELPEAPAILNNYAFAAAEAGEDLEAAQTAAEKALRLQPAQNIFADTLGLVQLKAGKTEAAITTLGALVRREGRNPQYRLHYGLALQKGGRLNEAKAEWRSGLEADPDAETRARLENLLR